MALLSRRYFHMATWRNRLGTHWNEILDTAEIKKQTFWFLNVLSKNNKEEVEEPISNIRANTLNRQKTENQDDELAFVTEELKINEGSETIEEFLGNHEH